MVLRRRSSRPTIPHHVFHHSRMPFLSGTCQSLPAANLQPDLPDPPQPGGKLLGGWHLSRHDWQSPQFVAKILAKVGLRELNLILSKHKSGFLVSSNDLKKALTGALPKNSPAIKGVLKDLGCDSTGGRLRRLTTQKARLQKGKRRLTRLTALPKKHGKRFTYTNTMPAVNFGHQTLGYSKTQIQKLRVMVGQAGAIRKGNGCLHTAIRTVFSAKYDPGINIPTENFLVVFKLFSEEEPDPT